MRRREFIAGFGSAAVWPVVARAQPATIPVAGFLHMAGPSAFELLTGPPFSSGP
jgi:hypothetical protein